MTAIRTAGRRLNCLPLARRLSPQPTRWLSFFHRGRDQTRFSYYVPTDQNSDDAKLLNVLGQRTLELANPEAHDAAVVLATPQYAKQVCDSAFVGQFARILAGDAHVDHFHIVCAIVEHLAPPFGEAAFLQGISVLRGHQDDMLPQLWHESPLEPQDDHLSSLTFALGSPSITLPLAQTTFLNGRPSTLITSCFDMSHESPNLTRSMEKLSQRVNMTLRSPPRTTTDIGLYAPLSPLTRPRYVTESLGNIVRRIKVGQVSVPASKELEPAVATLLDRMDRLDPSMALTPMGVWAMVTPKDHEELELGLDLNPMLKGEILMPEDFDKAATYLEKQFRRGSRFYQILSGGGGWGTKQGLLSLDPERIYRVETEEEAMAHFAETMMGQGLAPSGSQIQFYTTAGKSVEEPYDWDAVEPILRGVVFGVPDGVELDDVKLDDEPLVEAGRFTADHAGRFTADHFGALSSKGLFVSGLPQRAAPAAEEFKLNVPGCRLSVDAQIYDNGSLVITTADAFVDAP